MQIKIFTLTIFFFKNKIIIYQSSRGSKLKSFRILTFDGGGIRGALSIELLHRIILKYPDLLRKVNLVSGTSTGSIIASLLAKGVSIDGGVVANSPTAVSLLFVYKAYKKIYNIGDIKILSIGTGNIPERINGKNKNWGLFQWAFNPFNKMKSPILSLLMDGMADLDDIYCKEILKSNYYRVNPRIPKFIDLDEYKYIPYLKSIANSYDMSKTYDYIEKVYLK